ncbi:hypothetical protein AK812_SmicGene33323 [Symbiodinium microadriaticum]|uniref:Uncharacterized protein n=1 Tax=Symbiodinium microadriaticum TaxID=2951 RepID=A0A1Q9CRW8_SYMMI|nr:hypothetical protein AK812_SmicGene33323 [Symbiodinium microadriaticum]
MPGGADPPSCPGGERGQTKAAESRFKNFFTYGNPQRYAGPGPGFPGSGKQRSAAPQTPPIERFFRVLGLPATASHDEEGYGLFYLARKTLLATKQARVPRYVLGHGSWEAVLRGSGELPYEVKWTGMVLCVDGPTDTVFFAVATVCMVPRIAIGGAFRARAEMKSRPQGMTSQRLNLKRKDATMLPADGSDLWVRMPPPGARPPPANWKLEAVEDRVLQGLTWEEIASILDEDLRRRVLTDRQAERKRGGAMGSLSTRGSRTAWRVPGAPLHKEVTRGPFRAREDRSRVVPTRGPFRARELLSPAQLRSCREEAERHQRLSSERRPGMSHSDFRTLPERSRTRHGRSGRGHTLTENHQLATKQAIAKILTAKEDSLAQERGKLSSIGRLEERLVFLLRGCDTLRVTLCPGVVGKELYHALRIAGTQARPQLRRIEFLCNIQNRHSYGFAALQLGGKSLATIPDYCLSAGDFPLTSEEDFDNFGGSPDLKLEKKGRYPNTLTSWFRAALREAWAFSCVFGEEYYAPLEKAASHLLRLGEQHGYSWTATAVYSAWEELWARFCEEARELDRRVRREMKDESPTFARLKFFALSPGPDGQPWLQLPGTFRLEDDTQYFCTDMLPRMQRQLSRACWSGAQKRGGTAPSGGRAAGSEVQAEARSEPGRGQELTPAEVDGARAPSKLLGPSLHPREAARPGTELSQLALSCCVPVVGGSTLWLPSAGDGVTREGDNFAGLFDKRKVAQEGVDAQYRGTQRARVQATPHPSLKDHVEEAWQLIWTDAARGRVLLMSPEHGEEALLEGVVSVPLARVPKYNPDRSVSEKGRVIWDARVVNELCSKEDHFPAAQPKHAEVVRLIVWYQTRYPGVRILLAKKDISEAFKTTVARLRAR